MSLITRLTKLEKSFKPEVNDLSGLSLDEIREQLAKIAVSDCPNCSNCPSPSRCYELVREYQEIEKRLGNEW